MAEVFGDQGEGETAFDAVKISRYRGWSHLEAKSLHYFLYPNPRPKCVRFARFFDVRYGFDLSHKSLIWKAFGTRNFWIARRPAASIFVAAGDKNRAAER
jgi:hypothetical protein